MNVILLYLLLLKATVTTFNGQMSLPVLRNDFVVHRHVLTDRELSAAVAAAHVSPGPMGIYIVSVGYFVAGPAGAAAGWLALVTPAFIAIPLIRGIGRRLEHPRAKRMLDAAVLASAGLIVTSAVPLAQSSIDGLVRAAVGFSAFLLVAFTRVPTVAIIGAAGVIGALSSLLASSF